MDEIETDYKGVYVPPRQPQRGDTLHIEAFIPCSPFRSGIQTLANLDPLRGALLAIAQKTGDRHEIIGTAILVAPGIAISASHVFMQAVEAGAAVSAFAPRRGGGLDIWTVNEIGLRDPIGENVFRGSTFDVCVLSLTYGSGMPDSAAFQVPIIAPRMVDVGEDVFGVGYRAELDVEDAAESHGVTGIVSAGRVTQVYPEGRDRVMLPNPCFEVSMEAIGGMSGGPVFDAMGYLIGVISSSVDGAESVSPTFVSLVWPAMITELSAPWPPGMYRERVSLNILTERRLAFSELGSVHVLEDGRPQLRYQKLPVLDTYPAFPMP